MPFAVGKYPTARYSLLQLTPLTGRKHQIRRHLKHLRHPIIGDTAYGDLKQNRTFSQLLNVSGLMLHASGIQFIHPNQRKTMAFCADVDTRWKMIFNQFHWDNPIKKELSLIFV